MKLSPRYALALAVLVAVVLATGLVAAQQAPPSWKQGQPKELESSQLSPIAQPPAPKAAGESSHDRIKERQGENKAELPQPMNHARGVMLAKIKRVMYTDDNTTLKRI